MAARKATPPPVVEEQEPAETEETPEQEPTAVEAAYVSALQRERAGYARYGLKDRAADVEAELKRLGAPFERAVPPPAETA